jgi:signal transduction histidine kinase
MFEIFTKIIDDRELNTHGCGLGLSIAKSLSHTLGGDIKVDSIKGLGSTFILTIIDHLAIQEEENNSK